jgi:peptidoglycan biosynthesis protein MviN/MurJ (putative lipid II flippase)
LSDRSFTGLQRSAVLAAAASANIAASFLYNWYLLAVLGPGREVDALFAAMIAPQLLLVVVGTALSNVLIPMLSVQPESRIPDLVWTMLRVVFLYTGLAALCLALTARWWVPLAVPGFPPDARPLVVKLTAIQLVGAVLTVVSAVQRSAYNARHRFVWPEASTLLSTGLGFVYLAAAIPTQGVAAAAWATVVRAVLQVLFLLRGTGRYRRPRERVAELRDAWVRLRPLMLGALYFKTDFVVDRLLASMAPVGALSLYSLAQQAYSAAQLVLGKALAAPAVPPLSRAAETRRWGQFRSLSRRRLLMLVLMSLIGYVGVLLLGRPVLGLVFGHGKMTPAKLDELWWLFVALGGVWFGSVAGQIIAASFYAEGDTRTPMVVGAATCTVAIGLKVAGFFAFGITGLAVAASLYYLSSASVQWIILERRLRRRLIGPPVVAEGLTAAEAPPS